MEITEFIKLSKIIPVVKIENAQDTLPLMSALKSGGINIAEITFRTECGAEAIKIAASNCPDMLIGAGTVTTAEQAKTAIANGARFIVSPGFSPAVDDVCREHMTLYIAGCVTPTEIMQTIAYNNKIVKFFPAESFGGLAAIKALAAPFPNVYFVPTGGINASNIKEYLSFPKVIACGGSWMVKESLIKEGKFAEITALCKEAIAMVRS